MVFVMQTQKILISTPDGHCDSFIAYPDAHRKYPSVLLYMDAFGPRQYLTELFEQSLKI